MRTRRNVWRVLAIWLALSGLSTACAQTTTGQRDMGAAWLSEILQTWKDKDASAAFAQLQTATPEQVGERYGELAQHLYNEAKDLPALSLSGQVFIHSEISLDDKIRPLALNAVSTSEILKTHSKEIFQHVLGKNLKCESFYFRAPEDEFRMNP